MKIEKFVLGMVRTNCYLIQNEESKETVIVDPAIAPDYLIDSMIREGLIPKAILLTHGHFDHIMGIDILAREYKIPVYAYEEEKLIIENSSMNLSDQFGEGYTYDKVIYVKNGVTLTLAGYDFKVIATPGHTIGGCCYYVAAEEVLFSGDTLFCGSVGRSDFPTGSGATLVQSIKEKLMCLPENTVVYPGHEGMTTVGDEKNGNPFL